MRQSDAAQPARSERARVSLLQTWSIPPELRSPAMGKGNKTQKKEVKKPKKDKKAAAVKK